MERRREVRVTTDQKVRVTILGRHRHEMQGRAIDLSGRGMRIVIPDRVHPGDPVKIRLDDALLLGEVCYCRPHERGFVIGIELDQVLNGLADLERLNRELLENDAELESAELEKADR